MHTATTTYKEAFSQNRHGRFLSPDPYGQFYSAYTGMGNNPVNLVDPSGGMVGGYYQSRVVDFTFGQVIFVEFFTHNPWVDLFEFLIPWESPFVSGGYTSGNAPEPQAHGGGGGGGGKDPQKLPPRSKWSHWKDTPLEIITLQQYFESVNGSDNSSFLRDNTQISIGSPYSNPPVINPASNVAFAAGRELILRDEQITIVGQVHQKLADDPFMADFLWRVENYVKGSDRYMQESFQLSFRVEDGEFGGNRAPDDMRKQLLNFWKREYRATWKVGTREVTWLVRHADLDVKVYVSQNGGIMVVVELEDTLDLRPHGNDPSMYNQITKALGKIWHDWLRASEAKIKATFTFFIE